MTNDYAPFSRPKQSPLALVFAGAAFALATYLVLDRTGMFDASPSAQPRAITARGELAPIEKNFVNMFENVSPSVAHINTSSLVRSNYGVREQQGSGSGFVWDSAGIVVTNDHVVRGAREVHVTVAGRNYAADVINSSPAHDLAILKLRGRVGELTPIALGTSEDLRVGQTTVAIGNPYGFDQTMTTGIVSALNRTLKTEEGNLMVGLIQVDAAINPGNSGGPLLDSAGRLIGVTTAIYSPSGTNAGLGFAVPVDTVNLVVPRLLGGRATEAFLGVRRFKHYPSYRLSPDIGFTSGAIIEGTISGFGAEAAGLRPFGIKETRRGAVIDSYGDVIVAINGQPVRSFEELGPVLGNRKPGDVVKVTAIRGLPNNPHPVQLDVQLSTKDEELSNNTTGM